VRSERSDAEGSLAKEKKEKIVRGVPMKARAEKGTHHIIINVGREQHQQQHTLHSSSSLYILLFLI